MSGAFYRGKSPLTLLLDVVDAPMRALQRVVGVPRIGWLFVAPNLLILGLFTFLPIVIDFAYAFTGGAELYPGRRPWVGGENFATLFECANYLDPSTCRKDLFWRSLRRRGYQEWEDVGRAAINLLTCLFVITGFVPDKPAFMRRFMGEIAQSVRGASS